MRGGSQAHLVEAEDGCFFIAKFAGNPQGNRTLINEWITGQLMNQVGICTPPIRILQLPERLYRGGGLFFQAGNKRIPITETLHLGSQCPVNPEKTAIFDFLPEKLLPRVVNLADFARAFVLDKWLYQTDRRQAIFVRDPQAASVLGFRAYLIDHGMSFAGSQWELADVPMFGLCIQRGIYSMVHMQNFYEEALHRIEALTEHALYAAAGDIPSAWFTPGDYDCLANLFARLQSRKTGLRSLVSRHLEIITDSPARIRMCVERPGASDASRKTTQSDTLGACLRL
jgi:hypothetical protein